MEDEFQGTGTRAATSEKHSGTAVRLAEERGGGKAKGPRPEGQEKKLRGGPERSARRSWDASRPTGEEIAAAMTSGDQFVRGGAVGARGKKRRHRAAGAQSQR